MKTGVYGVEGSEKDGGGGRVEEKMKGKNCVFRGGKRSKWEFIGREWSDKFVHFTNKKIKIGGL